MATNTTSVYTDQGETLRDSEFKKLLIDTDKNRFYKVDSNDDRTVVAASKVTLESNGKTNSLPFISRTNARKKEHAEVGVIRKTMDWLKKTDLTEPTTVRLTTMATYSPCSNCRSKLKKMFEEMIDKHNIIVKYKLRISFLYHEKINGKRETDARVGDALRVWKREIKGPRVGFTLEAISVCDELQDHTPRPVKCKACKSKIKMNKECMYDKSCSKCKLLTRRTNPKRKKRDRKIIKNVEEINDLARDNDLEPKQESRLTVDERSCTATVSSSAQEQSSHHLDSPPSNTQ